MERLLLLAVAVALVYVACHAFLNAVEHLGRQLSLGPLAVGSVLAAVGTALPESVITFVAVALGHGRAGADIGVGAAMGGPLVLSTFAYGAAGLVAWGARRPLPVGRAQTRALTEDQIGFVAISVVKLGLGFVAFRGKPLLALAFLAAYALYVARELRRPEALPAEQPRHEALPAEQPRLEPLLLQRRRDTPAAWAVVAQTLVSLAAIYAGSQLFVGELEWAGPALGLSATVTALLLAPVATELPELVNAVIWMQQGKPRLALANISGAMMIQATVPTAMGLLGTPWRFDVPLVASGVVTLAATVYVGLLVVSRGGLRPRLLSAALLFYVPFVVTLGLA